MGTRGNDAAETEDIKMRIHSTLWALALLMVTIITFVTIGSNAFAKDYAQLSSAKTQLSGAEPKKVELETVDANSGFDVTSNSVTTKDGGVYFIMVEGQGGVVTQNQSQAGGYLKLWIIKNETLVHNTVSEKYIGGAESAGTFVTQTVLPLKKGDAIGVEFSSNKPGAGLVASPGEPKSTSVGFTIFKIAP
jgi:hypothetical protein